MNSFTTPIIAGVLVVAWGTLNTLTGRIKAKPLGAFNIFASVANSLVYVIVYAGVLIWQRRRRLLTLDEKSFFGIARNRSNLQSFSPPESPTAAPLLSEYPKNTRLLSEYGKSFRARLLDPKWKLFLLIGLLDATGNIMGLIAQAAISGPTYALSLQAIILFSALAGFVFLGDRYTKVQVSALLLVVTGAVVSNLSHTPVHLTHATYSPSSVVYAFLAALSTLPTACSFAARDYLMRSWKTWKAAQPPPACARAEDWDRSSQLTHSLTQVPTRASEEAVSEREREGNQEEDAVDDPEHPLRFPTSDRHVPKLNICVVGLLSSTSTLCVLPIVLAAQQLIQGSGNMTFVQNLKGGFLCLGGHDPKAASTDFCKCAPPAYIAYIVCNVLFNFSLLWMISVSSALSTFLAVKAVLPISIIAYALIPLPLLDRADTSLSLGNMAGLLMILSGLIAYAHDRLK